MDQVVRPDFKRASSIEFLIAEVMREARRRSGMSRSQFARALVRHSNRRPYLDECSIENYESGRSMPLADVYLGALAVSGCDIVGALTDLLTTGAGQFG